jgi:hypothetical protein
MMRQFETVSCGDGEIDPGEACDLGAANGDPGVCCSADCAALASGTPCSDDGDVCTDDECDVAGLCEHIFDPENDPSCETTCTPGDCNQTGDLDAGDPICTVLCLVDKPTAGADCACAADCNCIGDIEASDPICAVLRVIDDFDPDTCVQTTKVPLVRGRERYQSAGRAASTGQADASF